MAEYTVINIDRTLPLHYAASRFAFEELQHLLWEKAAMDYVNISYRFFDADFRTPFHYLIQNEIHARLNQEAVIKCTDLLIHYCQSLLKLGYHLIDGDSRCPFGSPLKLAVESRMSYCVSVLLDAGAKSDKTVALQIANNMPEIFLGMLDNGIKVDQGSRDITIDWQPIIQYHPDEADRGKKFVETEFLYSILTLENVETQRSILTHPLVKAYMQLEENNSYFKFVFWGFLFFTASYYLSYIGFTFHMYTFRCEFEKNVNATFTNISICDVDAGTFSGSLFFFVCNLGWFLGDLRAQFLSTNQFIATWRVWIGRIGNVIMMIPMWPGLYYGHLYEISWQYALASIGMFFSCVSFLITVGLYHSISIYIEMLFKIFLDVIKITILFLPLFAGFYLGFLLLFSDVGVFSFIFSTVEGSIGYEPKFGDVFWFDIYAQGFGVGFVILIVIIFLNFLLAISIEDMDKIRRQAEVMSISRKVHGYYMLDASPFSKYFSLMNPEKLTESYNITYIGTNFQFPTELIREMFDLKAIEKGPTLQKL